LTIPRSGDKSIQTKALNSYYTILCVHQAVEEASPPKSLNPLSFLLLSPTFNRNPIMATQQAEKARQQQEKKAAEAALQQKLEQTCLKHQGGTKKQGGEHEQEE
jgi:hypothetical protein